MSMKTIERLILYRRILERLQAEGVAHVYSHELAERANNTPAQVRRDLMVMGCSGSSKSGYLIKDTLVSIGEVLDRGGDHGIALVGVGNLGRAVLSYFSCQQPRFRIKAAFDSDSTKVDRVISGCRCHHVADFGSKVSELGVTLGIITVPAQHAQSVADMMVDAGIRGVLNFAPAPLRVPDSVFIDQIDITMCLEKVAYFARLDDAEERE